MRAAIHALDHAFQLLENIFWICIELLNTADLLHITLRGVLWLVGVVFTAARTPEGHLGFRPLSSRARSSLHEAAHTLNHPSHAGFPVKPDEVTPPAHVHIDFGIFTQRNSSGGHGVLQPEKIETETFLQFPSPENPGPSSADVLQSGLTSAGEPRHRHAEGQASQLSGLRRSARFVSNMSARPLKYIRRAAESSASTASDVFRRVMRPLMRGKL